MVSAGKVLLVSLLVVMVSGVSVSGLYVWQLGATVTENAVDISNGEVDVVVPQDTIGTFDGGFNVLVVGADNSAEQAAEFGERDGAILNDVNIVLHVAADHASAVVLSLPRDLVIPHPECVDPTTGEQFDAMSAQDLNTAFNRGGLGCVRSTVENLTGLSIPYAATFTFAGTVAMSDAVGGVPICVDSPVNDPASGLNLAAGTTVVSGEQALAYLRSRKGVGNGSDLSRISSQQAYMSSLMRVMKSSDTLTNPSKLLRLASAAAENVGLSDSLANLNTMASMALTLKDLDLDKLVFVQFPNYQDPDNPAKVVPDYDLADQLMSKIGADQPFVLDDGALGSDVTVDPNVPASPIAPVAPVAPTTPSTDTPAPTDPAADAPEILAGLRGQTGSQQTCSVAFRE
ncbi:MAG TPA: LCP family protein [Glaciibacter sp.]|nr:LCP family protein [Glaciibacter sp.]